MKLQRDSAGVEQPTFGTLIRDDGTLVCQTLELPWRGNQHGISRIPAGSYKALRFNSPHIGYELFQLANVPDRVGIDIHIGNTVKDTEGCILLGNRRGELNGVDAVLGSHDAFAAFMALMVGVDSFMLDVVDVPSTEAAV